LAFPAKRPYTEVKLLSIGAPTERTERADPP
jgi:hypothetical protein